MFELAWPWMLLLLPLPWLLRWLLPAADSGEAALKVSFLAELETLSGRRARVALPAWRQQLPYLTIWLLLLFAAARPQWLGEPLPLPTSGRDLLLAVDVFRLDGLPRHAMAGRANQPSGAGQAAARRLHRGPPR